MRTNFIPQKFAVAVCAAFAGTFATADVVDFQDLADNVLGESIWSTLSISGTGFNLGVTGTNSAGDAYAYLDHTNGSGRAGLGVCGAPGSVSYLNQNYSGGSTNRCLDSGDDNMTEGEALAFVFDVDVMINNIWLNNNHDGDQSLLNNTVNIGGAPFTFLSGPATGPADFAVNQAYFVAAFTPFDISFYATEADGGDQFYVSKMDVSAVPEPSVVALLGLGLFGLQLRRRKLSAG